MFDYLFLGSALEQLQKLPKEVVYSTAAYFTLTELAKRYAQVKTVRVEADARVRVGELEVEKLQLQLDLHNARIENPL